MVTNNSVNEPTAASGKVLQGQGIGVASNFSTATYPSTATGTGKILRADGTNWAASTATYPDTAGTSGNVLTSDGTNWVSGTSAGVGSLVLIQTQNASTSAAINFTTGITATYNNYVLLVSNVTNATGSTGLLLQISTNGGSSYITSGYSAGVNFGSAAAAASTNNNGTSGFLLSPSAVVQTTGGFSGTSWLYDFTVNNFPNIWTQFSNYNATNSFAMGQGGGTYFTAVSIVNAMRVISTSGNIAAGKFSLYGIAQ